MYYASKINCSPSADFSALRNNLRIRLFSILVSVLTRDQDWGKYDTDSARSRSEEGVTLPSLPPFFDWSKAIDLTAGIQKFRTKMEQMSAHGPLRGLGNYALSPDCFLHDSNQGTAKRTSHFAVKILGPLSGIHFTPDGRTGLLGQCGRSLLQQWPMRL